MPVSPWPVSLAGSPGVVVLERAIAQHRLAHSLLLQGEELNTLLAVEKAIADRLLSDPASGSFAPTQHPDHHLLRPAGKMRQISADATRNLIAKIQVTPTVGQRKVAAIVEADRMNTAAANIFLKTLEEPPPDTTLLLLTTRPYALLPTIRSRVLCFRFPQVAESVSIYGWHEWKQDYQTWLARLVQGVADKRAAADQVIGAYGLIARFNKVLEQGTENALGQAGSGNAAELTDEERAALETGIANGLRTRLFAEISLATRDFARPALAAGDARSRLALAQAIAELERMAGLLNVNLNEVTALEVFLLSALRIWSRR